jgi:putative flippase GtrA
LAYRRQFALFALIGALQHIFDALLFFLFIAAGMDIINANLISRAVVGLVGFIANRYITFRGTRVDFRHSFFRFLLAWSITSLLSTAGVIIAVDVFLQEALTPTTGLAIKVLVEIVVFLFAFLIQKFFIFGNPTTDGKRP